MLCVCGCNLKKESGWPKGTTRLNGYGVTLGRPVGTTAVEGEGVSPGRTVGTMKDEVYTYTVLVWGDVWVLRKRRGMVLVWENLWVPQQRRGTMLVQGNL